MFGTAVLTFSVKRHRRRHDDPTHVGVVVGDYVEEHSGTRGISAHVPRDVVHRLSDPNLGRQVYNGTDAIERLSQAIAVPDVSLYELGVVRHVTRAGALVDLVDEGVKDAYLITVLQQSLDYVGTDEAGAPGDQDH